MLIRTWFVYLSVRQMHNIVLRWVSALPAKPRVFFVRLEFMPRVDLCFPLEHSKRFLDAIQLLVSWRIGSECVSNFEQGLLVPLVLKFIASAETKQPPDFGLIAHIVFHEFRQTLRLLMAISVAARTCFFKFHCVMGGLVFQRCSVFSPSGCFQMNTSVLLPVS